MSTIPDSHRISLYWTFEMNCVCGQLIAPAFSGYWDLHHSKLLFSRFSVVGKLVGHAGPVITLKVPDTKSNSVITGSKDHYVKVSAMYHASALTLKLGLCAFLTFLIKFFVTVVIVLNDHWSPSCDHSKASLYMLLGETCDCLWRKRSSKFEGYPTKRIDASSAQCDKAALNTAGDTACPNFSANSKFSVLTMLNFVIVV